jgi:hypothetical protein
MDAVAFHLNEWIRPRVDWKLLVSIKIPPQWKYCLRPPAMAQPAAVVRFHAHNSKQILYCALHMQGARKYLHKAWIDRLRSRFHLMFENRNAFLDEKGSIDTKAAIAVAIIRTPKSKEPAPSGLQHLCAPEPVHGADLGAPARQV